MFRWNMKHSQWIRWVVFNPQLQRTDSVPQLNNQWWFDADLSKTWYRQAGKRWWLLVGLFHDRLIRMPPSSVPNFPSPITFLSNYPKIQWITPIQVFMKNINVFPLFLLATFQPHLKIQLKIFSTEVSWRFLYSSDVGSTVMRVLDLIRNCNDSLLIFKLISMKSMKKWIKTLYVQRIIK